MRCLLIVRSPLLFLLWPSYGIDEGCIAECIARRVSTMSSREWITEIPPSHVVRVEHHPCFGETYVCLDDDLIHFDRAPSHLVDCGFTHTFLIGGVSYSVQTRPEDRQWCEVYRTEDGPTVPPCRTFAQWILRVLLVILGCVLLISAYDSFLLPSPSIIPWIGDGLRRLRTDEIGLLIVLCLTLIGILYYARDTLRAPHRLTSAIDSVANSAAGSPPRRGSFFRPWLEDIHRIAMRCRRVKR